MAAGRCSDVMQQLTIEQFESMLADAPIKPRFKRELKFRQSTPHMNELAWAETELLAIWNKSKTGGIVLAQPGNELFMIPFDASKHTADKTGRSKPVICDLCYTWQPSSGGGFVTFYPDKTGSNSVSLLCCLDLRCSEHVRTKTAAGLTSRTQLREHMTNEARAERLRQRLQTFIVRLSNQPVHY